MKRCASCGEDNPDRARFCLACGAAILVAATAAQTERKVISVLFADLVGFTARAEKLDVEDVHGTLSPYHQLLRRELERFGGTVEKFIGDAVMAVFGAPVAHEDDAERAVRAGLAIQAAVAELRASDPALDLHVRIGVTTGEALVALGADPIRGEGMASGDVVNSAARLQSAAPIDGVLVGEGTFEATRRVIVYEPAEPVVAKGKAEPLAVWVAERPRALVGGEPLDEGAVSLVGRAEELGALVAALRRVKESSSVQLVSLLGAPGLGKSRLVAELLSRVEAASELTTWRQGRCLAYGDGIAFWAMGEMVKAQAGILESDDAPVSAQRLRDAVGALMEDRGAADWVQRHLRPLIGLETAVVNSAGASGESGRSEAFAAWRQFVEAMAEQRPTVLVFEDVHWADDGMLDFIDMLAERALGVPLLLLCTARPELLERRPGWGGGKSNALTVALPPLSLADTARLVSELFDQTLLPAELQAALVARADGNPLYAREYVSMLRDQGLLQREDGGWRLTAAGADAGDLPATVQGIIAARLDGLSPEEKRLMQNTAVIGRIAWVSAAAAVGEQSREQVDELLHALERKQLLRRARRSSMTGDVEFSFAHALIQDVAYGQIPRAGRAERHLRAATWIEAQSAGRDDKAELLAHHYATALSLLRQTGEVSEALTRSARDAFAEAGRLAASLSQHGLAVRHVSAALELTPLGDPARPALMLARARALSNRGSADDASLVEACDAQIAAGDWTAAAEISLLLAHWHWFSGTAERTDAWAERSAELAERGAAPDVAASAAGFRVLRMVAQDRCKEAVALADLSLARSEQAGWSSAATAQILLYRGQARLGLGEPEGIAESETAAQTLAANHHPYTATAYGNLADAVWLRGVPDKAYEHLATAQRWAERFGNRNVQQWLTNNEADLAYHQGRWDEALRLVEPVLADPQAWQRVWATCTRGRILAGRGPRNHAFADAEQIIGFGKEASLINMVIGGLAIRAQAAAEATAALCACDELLSVLRGPAPSSVPDLAAIAPILARAGRHGDLRAAAPRVESPSKWLNAIQATADGRYSDAAAIYASLGSLPDEAAAYVLAAEDHLAHGRLAEAERAAARAAAFYREVGATLYLEQVEAVLGSNAAQPGAR